MGKDYSQIGLIVSNTTTLHFYLGPNSKLHLNFTTFKLVHVRAEIINDLKKRIRIFRNILARVTTCRLKTTEGVCFRLDKKNIYCSD